MVLALALAIVGLPAFAAGEAETSEAGATAGGPQYGGTLTLGYADLDPPTADVVEGKLADHQVHQLRARLPAHRRHRQVRAARGQQSCLHGAAQRAGGVYPGRSDRGLGDHFRQADLPHPPWRAVGRGRQGARHGVARVRGRRHRVQPDALLDRARHGMAGNQRVPGLAGRHVRGGQVHLRGRVQVLQRRVAGTPRLRLGRTTCMRRRWSRRAPTTGPTWSAPGHSW